VDAATQRGILVVNATGRNANAVSDFTIGLMLAEARNIARSHYEIKMGRYREPFPNREYIPDMYGKTVGLFGFGYIGKLVAEKLSGFKMNILVHDPYIDASEIEKYGAKAVDKDTLFKEADFLSINARLTEETYHVVGKEDIDKMKKTAFFVNTARAGLVDYDALADALRDHRIGGAGLDVFDEEPIPQDSPYLKMDNVTLTAHLAGGTLDATLRSPELLIERIGKAIKGEGVEGVVNRQVLETPAFKEWLRKARPLMK
jgi:D-3-phosphoglycerate dehydrogenase